MNNASKEVEEKEENVLILSNYEDIKRVWEKKVKIKPRDYIAGASKAAHGWPGAHGGEKPWLEGELLRNDHGKSPEPGLPNREGRCGWRKDHAISQIPNSFQTHNLEVIGSIITSVMSTVPLEE